MDTMQGLKRTHYCGDVEGIGNEVVVGGYVQKVREVDASKEENQKKQQK